MKTNQSYVVEFVYLEEVITFCLLVSPAAVIITFAPLLTRRRTIAVCSVATMNGHTAMVRLLVRRGANVMITTAGYTRRAKHKYNFKYTNFTTYDGLVVKLKSYE